MFMPINLELEIQIMHWVFILITQHANHLKQINFYSFYLWFCCERATTHIFLFTLTTSIGDTNVSAYVLSYEFNGKPKQDRNMRIIHTILRVFYSTKYIHNSKFVYAGYTQIQYGRIELVVGISQISLATIFNFVGSTRFCMIKR